MTPTNLPKEPFTHNSKNWVAMQWAQWPLGWTVTGFWLLAVLIQLPLLFNSGYFSHDELQWASRADVASLSAIRWNDWLAFGEYQYRPLTFNLWLLLSHGLFDRPWLFHGVMVVWGAINASLLLLIARRVGLPRWPAVLGVLLFVASPYALYVHGWVATLADLLVLSALLLLVLQVLSTKRPLMALLLGILYTTVALISKESALSIPALLAVIWWLHGRQKLWFMVTLGAGLVAVAYLAVRLPALLSQPADTHYSLAWTAMPWRWLEYHLYWIVPNVVEPHTTLNKGWHGTSITAGLMMVGLLVVLWRSQQRLFWAFLLGGLALLGPVLPLAASAAQYGYLFAAWVVLVVAAAWQGAQRWGQVLIGLLGLLSVWHGVNTMTMMREVGQIQAVFSPALATAADATAETQALRLYLAEDAQPWVFIRLTKQIHSYRGVKLEQRVQWAESLATADYIIQADGQLLPVQQ